ncbi:MAG: glycosyltransferase family 2 protein [Phycisphaeraceae bacterium]|nr:glycosyltransferase family 2 protein [Phycisphaeraceae bacterium]
MALCTCDGRRFLREQLESLAAQTRLPDELIVVDDASTDGTNEITAAFAKQSPFPVRHEINPHRLGVTANFEKAIRLCAGELIALCDQDDVWRPRKLEELAGVMEADDRVGLVFCDLDVVDEALRPTGMTQWRALGFSPTTQREISGGKALETLLRFNVVTGCAMMFRVSLREIVLPLSAEYVHDEWIARIAAACMDVRPITEPLVMYRRHANQQVGQATRGLWRQWRYARQRMDQAYFDRAARRAISLAQRLEAWRDRLREARYGELTEANARHWRWRQRLGSMNRAGAAIGIFKAWRRGDYARFGYGWKSAVQDWAMR